MEERDRVWAVHVDFGHDRKRNALVGDKCCNFIGGSGFLRTKLIARKSQNGESAVSIPLIQLLQLCVVQGRQASEGGDVDHDSHTTFGQVTKVAWGRHVRHVNGEIVNAICRAGVVRLEGKLLEG